MMFICFDLEFTWGMQGGTAPWGKEKEIKKNILKPKGRWVEWRSDPIRVSKMVTTQVS